MNVLFIMADQLRWDHLGCAGHPWLKTPNIDALARRGVCFANAFVTSGVCGPSRMSYYTGRYPISHGATWNRVPLSVGEVTLGEMLRGAGQSLALAGKSHVMRDEAGLARMQIEGGSELATLLARGGFEEIDRYDGHHPPGNESGYPAFLRAQGYAGDDPWTDYVISGVDADGKVVSGWHMRNVHLPARVREEHSETAYMTDQAIAYIRRMGSQPWVLHLSYVKPDWLGVIHISLSFKTMTDIRYNHAFPNSDFDIIQLARAIDDGAQEQLADSQSSARSEFSRNAPKAVGKSSSPADLKTFYVGTWTWKAPNNPNIWHSMSLSSDGSAMYYWRNPNQEPILQMWPFEWKATSANSISLGGRIYTLRDGKLYESGNVKDGFVKATKAR